MNLIKMILYIVQNAKMDFIKLEKVEDLADIYVRLALLIVKMVFVTSYMDTVLTVPRDIMGRTVEQETYSHVSLSAVRTV